eukprot:5725752-Prymnesium_polylepis.1
MPWSMAARARVARLLCALPAKGGGEGTCALAVAYAQFSRVVAELARTFRATPHVVASVRAIVSQSPAPSLSRTCVQQAAFHMAYGL